MSRECMNVCHNSGVFSMFSGPDPKYDSSDVPIFFRICSTMHLHRSLTATVTLCIVFFLTFLGMRISVLESTSKPKSRPRAVLKLSSTAPGGAVTIEQQQHQQTCIYPAPCHVIFMVAMADLMPAALRSGYSLRATSVLAGRSPPAVAHT